MSVERSYKYYLHLGDLHFGSPNSRKEQARGVHASSAAGKAGTWFDTLRLVLRFLRDEHRITTYEVVVVTGDLTDKCREEGFREFNSFVLDMVKENIFPANSRRILVVPGNHDVERENPDDPAGLAERKKKYLAFAQACARYTIPCDPLFNAPFSDPGAGGLRLLTDIGEDTIYDRTELGTPEFGRKAAAPFFSDSRAQVYFHLFDSAVHVGRMTDESGAAPSGASPGNAPGPDGPPVYWAMVDEGQLAFMDATCQAHRSTIKEFDRWLKIAVLHHHLSDVPSSMVELRAFDRLVNSNPVKNRLLNRGFTLVLHGHHHLPFILKDSAIHSVTSNNVQPGWLWVASNGSIGETPNEDAPRSFNLIRLETDGAGRAVRAWIKIVKLEETVNSTPRTFPEDEWVPVWDRGGAALESAASPQPSQIVWSRLFNFVDTSYVGTGRLGKYVQDLKRLSDQPADKHMERIVQGEERLRWELLGDLLKAMMESFPSFELGFLLSSLRAERKLVRFRSDGYYTASTTYHDLSVNEDPAGEPGSSAVVVPVPVKVRIRSSEGVRRGVGPLISIKQKTDRWRRVPEQNRYSFPIGVGTKSYVILDRVPGQTITYRMTYRPTTETPPFHLSLADTRREYADEQTDNPETWDRHLSSLEVALTCSDLKLELWFPRKEGMCEYTDERDRLFVAWPSCREQFDDELFNRRRAILGDLGLLDGWTLKPIIRRHFVVLALHVWKGLKPGMKYGILWRPPYP